MSEAGDHVGGDGEASDGVGLKGKREKREESEQHVQLNQTAQPHAQGEYIATSSI